MPRTDARRRRLPRIRHRFRPLGRRILRAREARPPDRRNDQNRPRRHPPGLHGLESPPHARHVQLRNPSLDRGPRPRLHGPLPAPRPHPHRVPQGRHALLPHLLAPPRRRVLRLRRRGPQAHVRRRAAAARVLGLRAAGRGSVLDAADGGGARGFRRKGGSRAG